MTALAEWAARGVTFVRRGDQLVGRGLQAPDLDQAKSDKLTLLGELLRQEPAVLNRSEEMGRLGATHACPATDAARWTRANQQCCWPGCGRPPARHSLKGQCDVCWGADLLIQLATLDRCVRHPERFVSQFVADGTPLCHECSSARVRAVQSEQTALRTFGPLFPEPEPETEEVTA